MNILPIIILLFMLLKDKYNFSNLLDGVDLDALKPIFELFNIDPSVLGSLNSENFKEILSGNVNLKTLLPVILPLVTKLSSANSTSFSSGGFNDVKKTFQDFSPIKDIAGQNITTAFENYFD